MVFKDLKLHAQFILLGGSAFFFVVLYRNGWLRPVTLMQQAHGVYYRANGKRGGQAR